MVEKTLVPLPAVGDRRASARKGARQERRARREVAERPPREEPVEQRPETDVALVRRTRVAVARKANEGAVAADLFVLPPRALPDRSQSRFSRFILMSFIIAVVLPTAFSALFFIAVAADQYGTTSAFAVRGASSSTSSIDVGSILGMGTSSASTEVSDSYILQEYIHSREMVEILIAEASFLEVYSRPSADAYYRLDPSGSIEDFVDYWRMMSGVVFDLETGIMSMTVRAFRPADAETITRKVIEKSEDLVNELSLRSREDSLSTARREVEIAEQRFAESRKALANYRGTEQEIDPTAVANTRQTLVGQLEGELANRQALLTSLLATMSENSPRVIYVRNQIDALRSQIATERQSVAVQDANASQPVLTERLSRYEELLAEREFAERAYVSSLATLEAARVEALKQQRYLAVFVRGSAPELSLYPEGTRWTLILAGFLFLMWGLFALIAAAVRDRVA